VCYCIKETFKQLQTTTNKEVNLKETKQIDLKSHLFISLFDVLKETDTLKSIMSFIGIRMYPTAPWGLPA